MQSDDYINFLSQNWSTFENHDLSESLLIFFVLKNLYHNILPHLNEFSVIEDSTFNSVVDCHSNDTSCNDENNHYTSCTLLSESNQLLTESQKNLLKTLLNLESHDKSEKSYFNVLKVYYNNESEERSFMLVSESHLYNIIKEFTSILTKEKDKSGTNNQPALSKCNDYIDWIKKNNPSLDIITAIENELLKSGSFRVLILGLGFFLLHINPSFSGVSRRILKHVTNGNKGLLFNCTLIINNLIRLHPKETDLWEIKTVVTEEWFKTFRVRVKRFVLRKGGWYAVRGGSNNPFYSHLMGTIYKLFTDKILHLDNSFIPEVLRLKPYNNCVVSYLKHVYDCVHKYVGCFYVNKTDGLDSLKYLNRFREFTYLNPKVRYRICLYNAIFKLFSEFYKRLLRNFGFPGLFILYLNLVKGRSYNRVPSSVINHRDLFSSSLVYTSLDDDCSDFLSFCDDMIVLSDNCWIDNKSKLLYSLMDFRRLMRPFHFNRELYDLIFNYRVVSILNSHFSTWNTFMKLSSVYTDFHEFDHRRFRLHRPKRNKKVRIVSHRFDEYKSESVLIRKAINSHQGDGHRFLNSQWVYLDSARMCRKYNDWQIDNILNSFNQLLLMLLHLFRKMYKLKKSGYDLDLTGFRVVFETIRLAFRYCRSIHKPGNNANILVSLNLMKHMSRRCRLLFWKYQCVLKIEGDEPYYLEAAMARVSLMLLSSPFRFYIHWSISAEVKMKLLYRQVLKFK